MAKVSIIIPMYNVEKYIGQCIESCQKQSLTDIEIILINDESPDKSLEIAKSYQLNDSRIKIINQKNSGVSVARNAGIEKSNSDWIMFVDGDDWLDQYAVEKMYNAIDDNCDIVISSFYANYDAYEKKDNFLNVENSCFHKEETILLMKSSVGLSKISNKKCSTNIGVPWAKIYRKKFINNYKLRFKIGLKRMQDTIFNLECFNKTECIKLTDYRTYHYRIHGESSTGKYNPNFLIIATDFLRYFQDFIQKYNYTDELNNYYITKTFRIYLEIIRLQFVSKKSPLSNHEKKVELRKIRKLDTFKMCQPHKVFKMLNKKERFLYILMYLRITDFIFDLYNFKYNVIEKGKKI